MEYSLIDTLTRLFREAFTACGHDATHGMVVRSNRPDLSQFQCSGAMMAGKEAGAAPREVAECVVSVLSTPEIFTDLSIAGPGFINMTLRDDYLAEHARRIASDPQLGCSKEGRPLHIMLDFGGPNVAKPMHVGHLRSTIIGDCLQRLFRFFGDRVTSDIHLGDWGLQMGMLISELRRERPDLLYFATEYEGEYPAEAPLSLEDLQILYPKASNRCKTDADALKEAQHATYELQQGKRGYVALWRQFVELSKQSLRSDFNRLRVHFDLWRGESDYRDELEELVSDLSRRGLAELSQGATVVPASINTEGGEIPTLVLMNSEGGFLYAATELATIRERSSRLEADLVLYVVDKRQSVHFEQVFGVAKQASYVGDAEFIHVPFGTMNGPDGKPFKTREGGVMRLDELIDMVSEKALRRMAEGRIGEALTEEKREKIAEQVGLATLKFADLSNHRTTDYTFDIEQFSRFEGDTGPYLLYTAVRIQSILLKAEEQSLAVGPIIPARLASERDLMLALTLLPDAVARAYRERAPNYLCDCVLEVARAFSRFYGECHILSMGDRVIQSSWLGLAALSLRQISQVLEILGIEIPEQM